jgi:hypothetical protein
MPSFISSWPEHLRGEADRQQNLQINPIQDDFDNGTTQWIASIPAADSRRCSCADTRSLSRSRFSQASRR